MGSTKMSWSKEGAKARAKLSEAAVRNIRLRAQTQGASPRDLAREHGVATETIRRILRWETHAYVGEEGPGASQEDWAAAADIAASLARVRALAGQPKDAQENTQLAGVDAPPVVLLGTTGALPDLDGGKK